MLKPPRVFQSFEDAINLQRTFAKNHLASVLLKLPEAFAFPNGTDCIAAAPAIRFIAKQRVPYLLGMNPTEHAKSMPLSITAGTSMVRSMAVAGAPLHIIECHDCVAQLLKNRLLATASTAWFVTGLTS